jgi:hypothetical protein
MRHAPSVLVLGSIAYRGDHGRVFWRAVVTQYTAGRGCARHCRSGQPGRDRQTKKNTETVKAGSTAPGENAATATGCPARTARTGRGTGAGAPTAAFGKTQAKTEAKGKGETQAETQGKTHTKTEAQGRTKATCPAVTGGAKAEAKTQEAG